MSQTPGPTGDRPLATLANPTLSETFSDKFINPYECIYIIDNLF